MISMVLRNIQNSFINFRKIFILLIVSQIISIMSIFFVYGIYGSYAAKMQEIEPVSYTHLDVYKRQGVGSVLSFLPIIITLFFFLSILEDSGYMARVAFVMDKILRKIGLSGRSIVPMLIGFGCTVPGVMSSRTLSSERDRKMTILLTPFMSCSAKLPIYVLFTSLFFKKYAALVMILLYIGGIPVSYTHLTKIFPKMIHWRK